MISVERLTGLSMGRIESWHTLVMNNTMVAMFATLAAALLVLSRWYQLPEPQTPGSGGAWSTLQVLAIQRQSIRFSMILHGKRLELNFSEMTAVWLALGGPS